jgi:hypothetical protein
MKFKNNRDQDKLYSPNFTGILEWCDGINHVDWSSIFCYKNRRFHRENGPAVEFADGRKHWHLNGKYFYSEEDWKREVEKLRKNTLVTAK